MLLKSPKRAGWVKTLNELAEACEISLTGLANWRRSRTFPQPVDGLWSVYAVGMWRGRKEEAESQPKQRRLPPEDDPLLAGFDSPALERYRAAKASLAELDLAEREGTLLPLERTRAFLFTLADTLRHANENLQRQFGPEAMKIITGALDSMDRQRGAFFGVDDEQESEES